MIKSLFLIPLSLIVAGVTASSPSLKDRRHSQDDSRNDSSGQRDVTVAIPQSPLDVTAFLIDYGFLLDNYQYILSGGEAGNQTLRSAVRAFIRPLQDYQESYQNDSISGEKRQEHLLGLCTYLQQDNMTATEIPSEEWKEKDMQSGVMTRDSLSNVLKTRAELFILISDQDKSQRAQEAYQGILAKYKTIIMNATTTRFDSLIAEELDWNLFESRYFRLVKTLKKGTPTQIGRVRKYLAAFLRGGDPQDDQYEKILQSTEKSSNDEDEESGYLKHIYGKYSNHGSTKTILGDSTISIDVATVHPDTIVTETVTTDVTPILMSVATKSMTSVLTTDTYYVTSTSCSCSSSTVSRYRKRYVLRSDADLTTPSAIVVFVSLLTVFILI